MRCSLSLRRNIHSPHPHTSRSSSPLRLAADTVRYLGICSTKTGHWSTPRRSSADRLPPSLDFYGTGICSECDPLGRDATRECRGASNAEPPRLGPGASAYRIELYNPAATRLPYRALPFFDQLPQRGGLWTVGRLELMVRIYVSAVVRLLPLYLSPHYLFLPEHSVGAQVKI